ncbi:MAG: hypothetical protein ACW98X_16965 [Promethearchaeota archaeon]
MTLQHNWNLSPDIYELLRISLKEQFNKGILEMIERNYNAFPNDLFDNVKNEIIGLLKSLDKDNFPAISSYWFKDINHYSNYVSNFIQDSIY